MNRKHIQHLYNRAGFGILPKQLKSLSTKSKDEIVNMLFEDSKRPKPIRLDHSDFFNIRPQDIKKDKVAQQKLREKLKEKLVDLNTAWVTRLANSDQLLREKMTLFWANHFVCQDNNAVFAEQFNNTLRTHALGNFRRMTKAISREASMIKYLNLKQNRKESPNENFARELMELFTLGEGHYTERDIKESAKAFTGYNHNFFGKFLFKFSDHDFSKKYFFRRTGDYKGDDIIDLILLEKQCARFVCEKVYTYFVNDIINESDIQDMVSVFYPRYDIEDLMRFVFMSDWFYDEKNIGTKIKSPIEFLVGMHRNVPMHFNKSKQLIAIQKILGQILLYPPNVAGWKGGRNWIDSNTIFLRLRLPSILLNNAYIPLQLRGEFNDRLSELIKRKVKDIKVFDVRSNWKVFDANYKSVRKDELSDYIIQTNLTDGAANVLRNQGQLSKRDLCIQLMSLPEYQMC